MQRFEGSVQPSAAASTAACSASVPNGRAAAWGHTPAHNCGARQAYTLGTYLHMRCATSSSRHEKVMSQCSHFVDMSSSWPVTHYHSIMYERPPTRLCLLPCTYDASHPHGAYVRVAKLTNSTKSKHPTPTYYMVYMVCRSSMCR